jgi:hypothetical protein
MHSCLQSSDDDNAISTELICEVRLFPEETDFASVNTINFTNLWNEDSDVLLDARFLKHYVNSLAL